MYVFRINARRTSVTPQEIAALGLVGGENTIMDVDVILRDPSSVSVVASFQHAYVRATTTKRQIATAIRAKATTAIDASLWDGGTEADMVGPEFPV